LNFGPATYALGFAAGALSILSPCVLPLLPVLIATALNAHRRGPWALGLGLALSFTLVGVARGAAGATVDPGVLRLAGGIVLATFGAILLIPALSNLFARAAGALGNSGHQLLARVTLEGLPGQFLVGALLGLVWSPCVGPTLGAATTLASQGKDLGQISLLMLLFGMGAAAPLILLGAFSRAGFTRVRGRLLLAGRYGKQLFGLVTLCLGLLIASGADRALEAWILDRSPAWLTALTTRY
jgi:cytochrome c-type biogenesis protein